MSHANNLKRVRELIEICDLLSEWEVGFVSSINNRLSRSEGATLSHAQEKKLDELWDRACATDEQARTRWVRSGG